MIILSTASIVIFMPVLFTAVHEKNPLISNFFFFFSFFSLSFPNPQMSLKLRKIPCVSKMPQQEGWHDILGFGVMSGVFLRHGGGVEGWKEERGRNRRNMVRHVGLGISEFGSGPNKICQGDPWEFRSWYLSCEGHCGICRNKSLGCEL